MSAVFSACRTWRYVLTREWNRGIAFVGDNGVMPEPDRTVAFVGLNPSTADETVDDPTVRRCIGFARAWGYKRLVMLNAFAYRATDPRELRLVSRADAVGPANDRHLLERAVAADLVVCCWGVHAKLARRGETVASMLLDAGVKLHVLDLTKDGHPKHPLYLRGSLEPTLWEGYSW